MEKACYNCDLQHLCRWYIKARQISMLELPWKLTDQMLKDVKMQLPEYCGHYTERPSLEGPRDELGRLRERKPLVLWYPLAEKQPCRCWYCVNKTGEECYHERYKNSRLATQYTYTCKR